MHTYAYNFSLSKLKLFEYEMNERLLHVVSDCDLKHLKLKVFVACQGFNMVSLQRTPPSLWVEHVGTPEGGPKMSITPTLPYAWYHLVSFRLISINHLHPLGSCSTVPPFDGYPPFDLSKLLIGGVS